MIAGCAAVPDLTGPSPEEEIVRFYERDMCCPHCSVACVRADKAVFAGDPHAIYRLGSLTKLFLRAVFERLESEGRINLDSAVTRHAPFPLPEEYEVVTLRDLLESRSGLSRDFLNPLNPLDWHSALFCGIFGTNLYAGFEDMEGFAEGLRSARSRRQLRTREPQYSNTGFALLSVAVEKAVGKSLDDMLSDAVARRLRLEDTAFAPTADMSTRITKPCAGKLPWLFPRGCEVSEHPLGPALRGTGALFSSAADCARFFHSQWPYVDALLAEKPLYECDDGEDRGLLRVKTLPSGRKVLHRFGMIYGGASYVCYAPDSRTVLIILRNVTSWPAAEDFLLTDRLLAHAKNQRIKLQSDP